MASNIQKMDLVGIDLNQGTVYRSWHNHAIGMKDNKGDAFGILVYRDKEPVDLTGISVQGYYKNPQGTNIAITTGNTVEGNMAYVVLPQACYDYDGQFTLAIKLIGGGITGTMRIVDGMVNNTNVDGAVAPTGTVPTYQEVLSVFEQMQDALEEYDEKVTEQDGKIDDLKSAITNLESSPLDIGYEIGGISGGALNNSQKYIRSQGFYYATARTKIKITAPTEMNLANGYIYFYSGEDVSTHFGDELIVGGSPSTVLNTGDSVDYIVPQDCYFKIKVSKYPVTEMSTDDMATISENITITPMIKSADLLRGIETAQNGIAENVDAIKANNRVYLADATTTLFFESYNSGIYFKFTGSLYLRGIAVRTLRISYSGTATSVSAFDENYELVTSQSGEENCVYFANNTVAYFDRTSNQIKQESIANLTNDMIVIFAVSGGAVVGGLGFPVYIKYQNALITNPIADDVAEIMVNSLMDDWADDVQPVQIAQKKAFVFGVQTDTHYDPFKSYFTNGSHSGDDYARQLAIFTRFVGMNFICNLGDIICGYAMNTQEDSRKAMTDIVNRYIANSKCPVLFAVGNHDDGVLYTTSNGTQNYSIDEIITGAELYGRLGVPMYNTGDFVHGKELYYYIDFDDVRVIMLNTRDNAYQAVSSSDVNINRHNISNGQLAWFQSVLTASNNKKIIVMSHVGFVDGVRTDTYTVNNGAAVVSAIESFKSGGGTVIGVFSGHSHKQLSAIVNGINYICFDDGGKFAEIVMVDTDAKTIKTKMVGIVPSGDVDREFSYT